jgi:hypothetical protein
MMNRCGEIVIFSGATEYTVPVTCVGRSACCCLDRDLFGGFSGGKGTECENQRGGSEPFGPTKLHGILRLGSQSMEKRNVWSKTSE